MKNYDEVKFDDVPRLIGTLITEVEESKKLIINLEKKESLKVDKVYNVSEASKFLGIKVSTLRDKIKKKKIGASKIGKEWRFTQKDLDNFLGDTHIDSITETAQKYAEAY